MKKVWELESESGMFVFGNEKKVKVQCLKEDDAREQRVIANYLPERKRSVQKWNWMKVKVNGMTVEVNMLKVKWIKRKKWHRFMWKWNKWK